MFSLETINIDSVVFVFFSLLNVLYRVNINCTKVIIHNRFPVGYKLDNLVRSCAFIVTHIVHSLEGLEFRSYLNNRRWGEQSAFEFNIFTNGVSRSNDVNVSQALNHLTDHFTPHSEPLVSSAWTHYRKEKVGRGSDFAARRVFYNHIRLYNVFNCVPILFFGTIR